LLIKEKMKNGKDFFLIIVSFFKLLFGQTCASWRCAYLLHISCIFFFFFFFLLEIRMLIKWKEKKKSTHLSLYVPIFFFLQRDSSILLQGNSLATPSHTSISVFFLHQDQISLFQSYLILLSCFNFSFCFVSMQLGSAAEADKLHFKRIITPATKERNEKQINQRNVAWNVINEAKDQGITTKSRRRKG